ncbi:uncharacterized protein LOC128995152 [Macrosteles quadrilineatus]|uniref:uncharacterized protein LOC128995152 n=1 Tax=Macrosteles quadrilineatus TaxID=74068 RepID=UPI0023E1446B|nr:uncharacterized protein LOC128995152 [Macrosteles quadrilineatus]
MAELNDSADVFANSSTETVQENLDYKDFLANTKKGSMLPFMDDSRFDEFRSHVFTSSPMSPQNKILDDSENISFIANQFISEACNVPVVLYCPFCCFTCHFEFIFKDHIKNSHPTEIMNIAKSTNYYFEFHACPFCHAKFYVKDLLPKHVLHKHEDSVVFLGLGRNNYAQCRFCSFKLLQKHVKRLIMHVEKKHMNELENFLKHQNTSITLSSKDMKFFCEDIEDLNSADDDKAMKKPTASRSGGKVKRVKSILKPPKDPLEEMNLHDENRCAVTPPNNGSYEAIRIQNSARRKLRFDIPESIDEDKENTGMVDLNKEKKNKIRWFSLFKKEKKPQTQLSSAFKPITTPPKNPCEKTTSFFTKFHLENDGISPLTTNHFKCGLCHEDFENNAQLLNHLQYHHRGLNLTAQYRCGACNAKFYRNSYLVRHCWFHHTPLCLKKGQQDDAM